MFLMVIIGKNFFSYNHKYEVKYYRSLILPIFIYSIIEGCRWMRGVDYAYNYDIARGKALSGDFIYDAFAALLRFIGLPYWAFFILISALLIISLFEFIKPYKEAFIPCAILLYSFTMIQSENLMRQYAAISCMLLSYSCFFNKKTLSSITWIILAYFIHSSVLFILPFFFLFTMVTTTTLQKNGIKAFLKILPFIFLFLYVTTSSLKGFLSQLFEDIPLFDSFIAEKYLNEDYLLKATDDSDINVFKHYSLIDNIRTIIREIAIIISGYFLFNIKQEEHVTKRFLYIAYGLSCCGIIYACSLPDLTMEVLGRLSLYFRVFERFMEGYIIFYFLTKQYVYNGTRNRKMYDLTYWGVLLLLILELVWIIQPQNGSSGLGLKFIWS